MKIEAAESNLDNFTSWRDLKKHKRYGNGIGAAIQLKVQAVIAYQSAKFHVELRGVTYVFITTMPWLAI